ncbi:S8 family serine peptidase [Roseivivax lentus]|uniref:S8 family serine peptidase n=1 Tax=Roseivivax lentus TaxID=633194 RepID=UPI0013566ABD|nr:S8 family serine peptidase [Roseivivax lentus]
MSAQTRGVPKIVNCYTPRGVAPLDLAGLYAKPTGRFVVEDAQGNQETVVVIGHEAPADAVIDESLAICHSPADGFPENIFGIDTITGLGRGRGRGRGRRGRGRRGRGRGRGPEGMLAGTGSGQQRLDLLFEEETAHYRQRVTDSLPTIAELLREPGADDPYVLRPPEYSGTVTQDEVEALLEMQISDERDVRLPEINAQVDDIATPFLELVSDYAGPPAGVLRVLNLMDMAGFVVGYYFKRQFGRLRPNVFDPRIVPSIPVPTHSSYPSAHAVQTHLIAHGLAEIYEDSALVARFFDTAERISVNREYAGVHYASDTEAGIIAARAAFPILRLVMDEVFTDAIAEMNISPQANCHMLGSPGEIEQPPVKSDPAAGNGWNLGALGIRNAGPSETGKKTVVALFDTAVDVHHPALKDAIQNEFINLDYPMPLDDPWCMGSKGIGHGTAMAGLVAGSMGGRSLGVAPDAKILPVRCANLARDDHDDRFELGVAILGVGLAGNRGMLPNCPAEADAARIAAVVLSLDFQKPDYDRAGYLSAYEIRKAAEEGKLAEKIKEARDEDRPACDPFALAILIVQTQVAVVIPAGNGGGDRLAYPGNPDDYAAIFELLKHPEGRDFVYDLLLEMIDSYNMSFSRDMRFETRQAFDAFREDALEPQPLYTRSPDDDGDPFEQTGIIVVGAANYEGAPDLDPDNLDRSTHICAGYSQYGPGLCVLAPSDRDTDPPYRCDTADGAGSVPVPTADIRGPGGFAADPLADYSHAGQKYGFGGTSAAAAQVGGVISLLAERKITQAPSAPLNGPDLRRTLTGLVVEARDYIPAAHGKGAVDLTGF